MIVDLQETAIFARKLSSKLGFSKMDLRSAIWASDPRSRRETDGELHGIAAWTLSDGSLKIWGNPEKTVMFRFSLFVARLL